MNIIESARNTLNIESEALTKVGQKLDARFENCIKEILECKGRLVVTGIGKSAIIGQKIAATLNSTGTPSLFMHAADAIHGDLGMVQPDDIVLCISNSGNSPEIKVLIPLVKNLGNILIGMVGHPESDLALKADFVLDAGVEKEACPNNLAPTASTTAQLALGDALAVCLMQAREFKASDFARFHPGGSIGKKLYLRVADLLRSDSAPSVSPEASVKDVIVAISAGMLGATAVLDGSSLKGIITDGDLRRMLEIHEDLRGITAVDIMTANPKTIGRDELAASAMELMEKHKITQLPVMDKGQFAGIIHLHQIVKEGII
jgi:arabinose-5-phosphate isomerase